MAHEGKTFPILGEDDFLDSLESTTAVALGIGAPHVSHKILMKFQNHPRGKHLTYPNLIHPSFVGSRSSVKWGQGNIVTAGVTFTVDIEVGSFNVFNLATTVGHDVRVGSFNVFNPGCNVSGSVEMGDRALVGTNATVLQGLRLESDLIVGAGSVVTKDLEGHHVYVGNPAKVLKELKL